MVDDLEVQAPIETLPTFHCYVLHDFYRGEPYALAMHAGIFKKLHEKKEGFPKYLLASEVARLLAGFIKENFNTEKVVVAGKNFYGFDWQFMKQLPGMKEMVKLHHRSLDPGILYMNASDSVPPSLDECLKRAGFNEEIQHDAVGDAKAVIKVLRHKFPL